VDELGNVIDGDYILAIYGLFLKEQNRLKNNTIVGTVMSNLGLVKFCEKNNINFVSTKVGDRYVLENMLEFDYIIGGEQSGHIIFKELANTGDGELTAIKMLEVMVKSNKKLSELASVMEKYPQVLRNVNVSKEFKETYKENETVKELIATRRSRKELYNYQDKIEELRNDPRFGGDSALWTYGENDDWIQEKYPWIKELVEKYVDIPSYDGQPGYNMILDEDIDNALNNAIEESISHVFKTCKMKMNHHRM
jgi:phosphomannomutase